MSIEIHPRCGRQSMPTQAGFILESRAKLDSTFNHVLDTLILEAEAHCAGEQQLC